jgi:hypothetical protein
MGQRHSRVGGELRWSAEVVAGTWSTGKWRGSEERRQFGQKKSRRRSSPCGEVAAMAAANRRSDTMSRAREGPSELVACAGRVRLLELG